MAVGDCRLVAVCGVEPWLVKAEVGLGRIVGVGAVMMTTKVMRVVGSYRRCLGCCRSLGCQGKGGQ